MEITLCDGLRLQPQMDRFLVQAHPKEAALRYRVEAYDSPPEFQEAFQTRISCFDLYGAYPKYALTCKYLLDSREDMCYLFLDLWEKTGQILVPIPEKGKGVLNLAPLLGIELLLADFGRVLMHGSIVRYHGRAVLFTGQSGAGKSTQAALWERYRGADVLNGDRAVLEIASPILAYGSPFAGSSDIYRNESAPVSAIVFLKQGKENQIREIHGREKLFTLYPRFLFTQWEPNLLQKQLPLFEQVIQQIPAYCLTCRPDEGAVELVENTIFGEKSF